MNDYTKGILTGTSLILCFFMFVSAKSQKKEFFNEIFVNSIRIIDEDTEETVAWLSSGGLVLSAPGEEPGMIISSGGGGGGFIQTFSPDGKEVAYLGAGETGGGYIETWNKHGVRVGYFGANKGQDGIIALHDRYGDIGWGETGKK